MGNSNSKKQSNSPPSYNSPNISQLNNNLSASNTNLGTSNTNLGTSNTNLSASNSKKPTKTANVSDVISAMRRREPFTFPETCHSFDANLLKLNPEETALVAQALNRNNNLTSLLLADNDLIKDSMEKISEVLADNRTISVLNIACNNIGPEGTKCIANVLKKNNSLINLNLSCNNIGLKGALYLADALKSNISLRHLNIYGNGIELDGISSIASCLSKCQLIELNIANNGLGPEGAKILKEKITENIGLKNFNISWNNFGPEGAKYIAGVLLKLPNLEDLNLEGNDLGSGIEVIGETLIYDKKKIKKLNISSNKIIQILDIALYLEKGTIIDLNLSGNQLGDKGAENIAQAITSTKSLTKLNIYGNSISSDGAAKIFGGVKKSSGLIILEMRNNGICSPKTILESLGNLVELNCNMSGFTEDIYQDIKDKLKLNETKIHADTQYLGMVNLLKRHDPNNFKSCRECVLELVSQDNCEHFPKIVKECELWINAKLSKRPDFNQDGLSNDELLALALYTWDLGNGYIKTKNLYVNLNSVLRERSNVALNDWAGYLFYLQNALSKLPKQDTIVYRGVPNKDILIKSYTKGRRIHWSSYSSTSKNIQTAIQFAEDGGVILEIHLSVGKSISSYSQFTNEEEILLSPNMAFIVTESIHLKDGYDTITLVQESPDETFVF